ncbi:hypothetical protein AAB992_29005 [Burkholderia contaminans]|nr:hypothetical protein [Burkholderia contaminans]WFN15526.1 hypothetical protein LXE92_35265 [Burkholderia contaminans]
MKIPENRSEDPFAKRVLIEQILQRKRALVLEPLDVQIRPAHIPMSFAQERLFEQKAAKLTHDGRALVNELGTHAM